jgi:predicted cobalt transporter CbtA
MKTLTFIVISLLSGLVAGTVWALVNQGVVAPFIDRAISIESQKALARGEIVDPAAMNAYRLWQREGGIVSAAGLGLSYGALMGLVYAYCRRGLPGKSNIAKAAILGGILWIVVYFAVAIKYPANPPAVGNPETITLRQELYLAMWAISGSAAVVAAFVYRKMGQKSARKVIAPLIYASAVIVAFFVLPSNPDAVSVPMDLINGFRISSAATMAMFWIILGITLGALWDKTKPHETAEVKKAF